MRRVGRGLRFRLGLLWGVGGMEGGCSWSVFCLCVHTGLLTGWCCWRIGFGIKIRRDN